MTKEEFIEELKDILELEEENIEMETPISLDSLSILSVIAFLDENYSKKATAEELRDVGNLRDIANIAGVDNF